MGATDTSDNPQLTWEEFLRHSLQVVKQQLQESRRLEDDGSGPPNVVALRTIIDKLPCPIKVVELRFDRTRHSHLRSDLCPILVYDLANLGRWDVHVHEGAIDAYNYDRVSKVLAEECGVPLAEARSFAHEMQHEAKRIGSLDMEVPQIVQFVFGDPRQDPGEFEWRLATLLDTWLRTIQPQVEATDYITLY